MTEDPEDDSDASVGAIVPAEGQSLKQKMEFLRGARQPLTRDEAASPIASRFLIEEIERLDDEVRDLRQFRDKYHEIDKEAEVLRRDYRYNQSLNLKDAAILAVGSAGLGAAPSYIEVAPDFGWIFVILSAVIVLTSISWIWKK